MRLIFIFTFIWTGLILTPEVTAQTSLSGFLSSKIIDSDGTGVSFATITLHKVSDESMVKASYSEDSGDFSMPGIQAGEYFFKISYIGYEEFVSKPFNFDGSDLTLETILLSSQAQELDEIIVKGKKPIIEIKPDKTVFNIEGSVNAQGDDALGLLKKSPGVIVDNNDNIQLQGRSGVRIYIDNKPSPLSASDLANFLRGLQSSDISAIEIITNPSSKYEAEGNAGIINIILKKNKNLGVNTSFSTGVAVSEHQTYNASINTNYRNKKTNLFGSYSYTNNTKESFIDLVRTINNTKHIQSATILNENRNNNFKLGLDYYKDDKNTFGVLVNGFLSSGGNLNESENRINQDVTSPPEVNALLIAKNDIESSGNNFNFNGNYQFKNTTGRTLNIDLDYGVFNNKAASAQPNNYYTPDGQTLTQSNVFGNDTKTDINIYTLKIDHEQVVGKGTIGLGSKISLVKTDNKFDFFNVIGNVRELNLDRSNQFVYDEQVSAGYINYQYNLKKWSFQGGVRVEQTHSTGMLSSSTQNNENDQEYLDVFPSGGVTYSPNQKNTWRFNYSKRLDRPNYQDLNPFEFKLDELSFMKGNPNLNPQYTQSIQLSHTYNYSLNTSINYSRTTDLMTRLTDTLNTNASFLTWENLDKQNNYSINVSYPFSPTEWWNIYANATAYRVENRSSPDNDRFTEGKSINLDANVFTFFAQNTITLPKGFLFEISGFYNSPGVWGGNFKTDNYWNIDLGLQKKLFDDRATLKIGVSDVLLGQRWHGVNNFGVLGIDANGGDETRRFKINFTYLFGNNQVKAARRRQTGLEDEKKRSQPSGQ